jgi:adenylate cyclase
MSETRKLAAILCSDVVGYSRLAGADEDRILARLRALRSDLIDPTIAVHHGRVVKRTGDGSIVEFRSVVDAVRCAIELQNAMVERNAGVPEDRRIVFRIGIHIGDVVEESDGDLMGDGVNIAARLESIAAPGAICLSEDAYRQVSGRLDMEVTDLGPTELKNIAKSVRVYSLQVGVPAKAKPTKRAALKQRSLLLLLGAAIVALIVIAGGAWRFLGASRPAGHFSMVVLPFTNLSNDPSQDYFADGITENLTTELARGGQWLVIARNTAFTFKGKNVDAKEIGKELGVRYVLEGSVQRDKNQVRVNAQLIDAESGAHLWADRFEEDVADLFKLQDQIVLRLADATGNELVKVEAKKGARSSNPDAVDLTMRGIDLLTQTLPPTKEAAVAARTLFDQALKIDPNESDAFAGQAASYLEEYFYFNDPETDYDAKILGNADRAIAINPYTWAYGSKCNYLTLSGRPKEGLAVCNAGLAVNPSDAFQFSTRSTAKSALGQFEQAKADVIQAMRLSPRDPAFGLFHIILGDAELGLGHLDVAIDEYQKGIDAGFRTFFAYTNQAAAFALNGKMEEAKSALAEARRLNPDLTVKWMIKYTPNLPAVFEGVRKAGLPEE